MVAGKDAPTSLEALDEDTNPIVTVCVFTKNPGQLFKLVVKAVMEQELNTPFDFLIIDSGSTDGTIEFINQTIANHNNVKLIEIKPHEFGHGKTRNFAISSCSTKYIAMLTHDAMPASKDWLSNMLAVAEKNPAVGGVFGRHIAYENTHYFTKKELNDHFDNLALYPIVSVRDDIERFETDIGWRQLIHFFSDNNSLIRRKAWLQVPYPNVDFAEDQIWAKEITDLGWAKAYCHDAAVFHSHEYNPVERLQRSFDESYALKKLFGYNLCPSIKSFLKSLIGLSIRDAKIFLKQRLYLQEPLLIFIMPIDHAMKLIGHWLGARGDAIPDKLKIKLSRDKRLLAGLIKSASLVKNK